MQPTISHDCVSIQLGDRSYPILIGTHVFGALAQMESVPEASSALVVTNTTVGPLYASALRDTLVSRFRTVHVLELPDGEVHKNWQTLNLIFDALLQHRCDRKTVLFALGGGVVGDMTGFAAASFMRGVPFVQVPTTLLAQVDSSVGGKTGINHPLGKNMIGAFYQPRAVLIDTHCLSTLPRRELAAGLAEVIKYGAIRDAAFFAWLEDTVDALIARDPAALARAIHDSCRIKAAIVAADEREEGERALLNFGHTFGHAIENALGYGQWLHGEAVAAGMAVAARVSHRVGRLPKPDVDRIEALIARASLPTAAPALGFDRWKSVLARDKKVASGTVRYVLLDAIGKAVISADVGDDVLREHLR